MGVLRIKEFSGIIPVSGDRELPNNFATDSVNTWLYGKELRGLRPPKLVIACNPSTKSVFRVPKRTVGGNPTYPGLVPPPSYIPDSTWLQFDDPNTDIIKGQLVEDSFERYYFCSPSTGPVFNTYANLASGIGGPYKLGVPGPDVTIDSSGANAWKPIITSVAGGTPPVVGRGYTYTWVNIYGEESQPALPGSFTGNADGTWNVTNILDPPAAAGYADYQKKYLYRTITGATGQTTFYRVNTIPIGTTTYADNMTDAVLTNNLLLESTNWAVAPSFASAPVAVTAATAANPAVITVSSSNIGKFLNSQFVTIAGATGTWIGLNGTWTITSVNLPANTIKLVGCNTSTATGTVNAGVTIGGPCLQGFVAMPNGFLIGFDDNNVYMSESYRWHAWPPEYKYATETPIVGLGVIGQTCVVCTQGYPTTVTGSKPQACSFTKATAGEPCLSRSSIVSTPNGVIYASQNGLNIVHAGGINNVTQELITRDDWVKNYAPQFLRGVRYQNGYLALRQYPDGASGNPEPARSGFFIDPSQLRVALTELSDFEDLENLNIDFFSGEVFLIKSGEIFQWDPPPSTTPEPLMPTRWRSKEFQHTFQENFTAYAIHWDAARYSNVAYGEDVLDTDEQVRFRVWADRVLRYDQEVPLNGRPVRLPSGFKAEIWQFEIAARAPVYSLHIASTMKELKQV